MDKKFKVFCNWKNQGTEETVQLYRHEFKDKAVEVVIMPSDLLFETAVRQVKVKYGIQNVPTSSRTVTGESNLKCYKGRVSYALVGHSERRRFCNEKSQAIRLKIKHAISGRIRPILCIGENQKMSNKNLPLHNQIRNVIKGIGEESRQFDIAYEPAWAIGKQAMEPDEIRRAVEYIRKTMIQYKISGSVYYGGAINKDNCLEIARTAAVDGLLVGSKSLTSEIYVIIEKLEHLKK